MTAKFDGLAENYDRARPRYSAELFAPIAEKLPTNARIIDCGAGTGIALEVLLPLLGSEVKVSAVDLSEDMISIGRKKFPDVHWNLGYAEESLQDGGPFDLVLAAQAYQWMDRQRYLTAAVDNLAPGGIVAIIQNNRDYTVPGMAQDYEGVLEQYSSGYRRDYRAIDIFGELKDHLDYVNYVRKRWARPMGVEEFVTMSTSSTQAQRAIEAHGEEFLNAVRELAEQHATDGTLELAYCTELFYGWA